MKFHEKYFSLDDNLKVSLMCFKKSEKPIKMSFKQINNSKNQNKIDKKILSLKSSKRTFKQVILLVFKN